MNKNCFTIGLLTLIVLVFTTMCASEKALEGGPRDKTPPVLLFCEPEFGTTNFTENIIKINFDEYLQLKNINEQMVISPPMKNKPDVQTRGKSVMIKIKDTLRQATTYTMFFGDAIADLNEGNPYTDFRYVFSTGTFIDSLSITGKIIDAENGEPVENIWVVLYPAASDTMFFTTTPYYISSTDKSGVFHLDQLKDTLYKCFAIEDINSNYFFDLPAERIAFLDSVIQPGYITKRPDSLPDSIVFTPINTVPYVTMKLYSEPDTILKLMEYNLVEDYVIDFVFNNDAPDIRFKSVDSLPLPTYIFKPGVFGDTLRWWVTDTAYSVMNLAVINDTVVLDTVKIQLSSKEKKTRRDFLTHNIMSGSKLSPEQKLTFRTKNPMAAINQSPVILKSRGDSIEVSLKMCDSLNLALCLDYSLDVDTSYALIVNDSCIFDIYGNTNDSLVYSFAVANKKSFGSLELEVILPEAEGQYILSLTDSRGKAITTRTLYDSKTVTFQYLRPGKYGFTLLLDEDVNGRWSSGRITKRLQPESVIKYDKEISVKANWVHQELWDLKKHR